VLRIKVIMKFNKWAIALLAIFATLNTHAVPIVGTSGLVTITETADGEELKYGVALAADVTVTAFAVSNDNAFGIPAGQWTDADTNGGIPYWSMVYLTAALWDSGFDVYREMPEEGPPDITRGIGTFASLFGSAEKGAFLFAASVYAMNSPFYNYDFYVNAFTASEFIALNGATIVDGSALAVHEPTSFAILALGLFGLASRRLKKQS
jgi:hypothetical protein